ncbi:MAG: HEPN domain-containing protein [Candidatus Bathyarchaeia archaeon]
MSEACFASHQAAKKTVKALYQAVNIEVWGHSVSRMLESPPKNLKPPAEIIDMAKELNRHYIPSRYPNFHPEGAPLDYYTRMDAERAIKYVGEIIGFVRSKIL